MQKKIATKNICYECREYNDSFNIENEKKNYFYSDSCLHSGSIVLRRSLFIDVSSISILIPYYVFFNNNNKKRKMLL